MNKAQAKNRGTSPLSSLYESTRKAFAILALAILLVMTIGLAKPYSTALAQGACLQMCQEAYLVCLSHNGISSDPTCEDIYASCIDHCLG